MRSQTPASVPENVERSASTRSMFSRSLKTGTTTYALGMHGQQLPPGNLPGNGGPQSPIQRPLWRQAQQPFGLAVVRHAPANVFVTAEGLVRHILDGGRIGSHQAPDSLAEIPNRDLLVAAEVDDFTVRRLDLRNP